MLKNAFYVALFTLISWGTYQLSYPSNTPPDLFYDGIFFENIIKHVDQLTRGPRAVGEYYHEDAERYIISQLQNMGLTVNRQRTIGFNPNNKAAAPIRNLIATVPGKQPEGKDLLVMAHYDAAKFAGTGAADDASGVAVILESINALLKTNRHPINDVIILITDAEEIGLVGAHAFINERLKNYDIGLIINLEARGSSGPSMMWPETTHGNQAMIAAFAAANVPMPVTTSLHYEIYRMLPNDTDLTPFNQQAKINGFNFAFIDDVPNYHTSLDTLANLSLDTLAHQTIQFHHMVQHFANIDLSDLNVDESLVYFSIPEVGLISYPTLINWLLLALSGLALLWVLVRRLKSQQTTVTSCLQGLIPLIIAGVLAYAFCWLTLTVIAYFYPETKELLQGFPYQGHAIMLSLLVGSAWITMTVYGRNGEASDTRVNQLILGITVWLIMLLLLAYVMPGSGLLVIPLVLSVLLLLLADWAPKLAEHMAPVLASMAFVIMGMLLINLPIALGVDALPFTAVLVTLMLALFVPVISPVRSTSLAIVFLLIPMGYLAYVFLAHPTISIDQPHPTSLSFLYDVDESQGYYYHYDLVRSGWNDDLFTQQSSTDRMQDFRKKYRKPLKNLVNADTQLAQQPIGVRVTKPLKQTDNLHLDISLEAHNNSEILEIFTHDALTIHAMSIDGRSAVLPESIELQSGQRLLQYYFDGKKNIQLSVEVDAGSNLNWLLQTHSSDLLTRNEFGLQSRPTHQIQKPFIKSDVVTVVQSVTFGFDQ